MTTMLRQADATRATSPADSAALYGQIAARLQKEGFRAHGHASTSPAGRPATRCLQRSSTPSTTGSAR